MAVFRNLDPEGEWQLFIAGKARGNRGGLAGGRELLITADLPKS